MSNEAPGTNLPVVGVAVGELQGILVHPCAIHLEAWRCPDHQGRRLDQPESRLC